MAIGNPIAAFEVSPNVPQKLGGGWIIPISPQTTTHYGYHNLVCLFCYCEHDILKGNGYIGKFPLHKYGDYGPLF